MIQFGKLPGDYVINYNEHLDTIVVDEIFTYVMVYKY